MQGNLSSIFGFKKMDDEEFRQEQQRILQRTPVPVFWLFGKTGSGKTSIVKFLSKAERAEIGNGFQPQTRHSEQYDFPASENPVLRFLDTRGLGESRYDPAEDIERFDESTHVMIVTVRVMDHALAEVVEPLRKIRQSNPRRPVVLALTCLHEAYPQQQHPDPDPFQEELVPQSLPSELRRCLREQQKRFEGLVDVIVPIDFTRPEEGFDEPNFGGERLQTALLELLPDAYRQTLLNLEDALQPLEDLHERRAMPYVLGYSTMAATAAAVPTPWVDIPAVMGIQSHLVYRLADLYGQEFKVPMVAKMAGSVGMRLLTRMLLRGPLKVIPVLGMAANAALAFAYTYALGKACCWYFGKVRAGNVPSSDELEQVWKDQLAVAAELWKKNRTADSQEASNGAADPANETEPETDRETNS